MPGDGTPWPGTRSAIGPVSFTPTSSLLCPLQERRAPGESGSESREQNMVAALHAARADRLVQRERDRCAGGVAVLVDVDRHALDRQADAACGGVDDAEGWLVRNPQVDVVQLHAGLIADLVGLADEDIDRGLEDVGSDQVDLRLLVLRPVRALLGFA